MQSALKYACRPLSFSFSLLALLDSGKLLDISVEFFPGQWKLAATGQNATFLWLLNPRLNRAIPVDIRAPT